MLNCKLLFSLYFLKVCCRCIWGYVKFFTIFCQLHEVSVSYDICCSVIPRTITTANSANFRPKLPFWPHFYPICRIGTKYDIPGVGPSLLCSLFFLLIGYFVLASVFVTSHLYHLLLHHRIRHLNVSQPLRRSQPRGLTVGWHFDAYPLFHPSTHFLIHPKP